MRTHVRRGMLSVAAAIGVVFVLAAPAAATHYLQHFEMHHGRITVGGVAFDSPGAGIPNCPEGTTEITTTVDDVAGTITTTINITAPFQNFLVGNNFLQASGTGHGTYNPATKQANVTIPLTFTIRAYTGAPTCAPGAVKCAGTAHLAVTIQYPAAAQPVPAGDTVYANATGAINTVSPACPGFLGQVVRPGATVTLGANPAITPPQPGAHFTPI